MKTTSLASACALLVAAAFATAPAANAATTYTYYYDLQQPAGVCQPAREYPDLRVRQIEIDNIGTTNAYVVCAPNAHYENGATDSIYIAFKNAGTVDRKVKCTLHNTWVGSGMPLGTVVQEVDVPAGTEDDGFFYVEVGDPGISHLNAAGIQCILPSEVSIGYVYVGYEELDQY
jgi:hypothetical protein